MLQEKWDFPWEPVRWAALPFGGGIGRSQSVCGAVSAGAMAIGMRLGQRGVARDELAGEASEQAGDLMRRFQETFGHVDCRVLTGHDFNEPDGYKKWQETGLREDRCVKYVGFVARYLAEPEKPGSA